MREIEVKARVESVTQIIAGLERAGIAVAEPVTQRDQVFGVDGLDGYGDNQAPWLRIRSETKGGETKYLFTLKKSVTDQLDSIEHETEVSDPEELRQIILHSGFAPYSDIVKTRRKAKLDDIELCIDEVEKLGKFVEAEKLTNDDVNIEDIRQELWEVLGKYGVSRDDQVTGGYDTMIKKIEDGVAKLG